MGKVKIHPTEDHIVVEALDQETKTSSGIYIPETASKEKPQRGKVIAVGPGKMTNEGKRLHMECKVGDTVLFSKYGPTEVKVDDKELLILSMSDVLAVLEE